MADIRYVSEFGTFLVRRRGHDGTSRGAEQKLLGARLHVDLADVADGQIGATDMHGHSGFVPVRSVSPTQQLKVFYTDVGQGDASLIEAEGAVIIIDGGPNRGFFEFLEVARPELAFLLGSRYWGQGYATEVCRSVLAWAFERHSWHECIALVRPANHAAIRVCSKLGMRYESSVQLAGQSVDLYQVSREEFEGERDSSGVP